MYSQDKIDAALKVYHQCGSVTITIRVLGYPTKRTLYTWIANEGAAKPERKPLKYINTAERHGQIPQMIPLFQLLRPGVLRYPNRHHDQKKSELLYDRYDTESIKVLI